MLKVILESIHEQAVDAIITINAEGIIQTVNPATQKMFGYAEEELIGRNVNLLMPAALAREHNRYLSNYLETRVPKIIGVGREVTAISKSGKEFPIHLAVSEIQLETGTVFVGFVRDLSEYKKSEARMQHKLLINERLAAIGQTVSGLAHESRNAFQRSHACLEELALDLAEMPESLKLVRKVQKALDDLHRMLEEVRSYAAPVILERRQCSFLAMVKEAWQNLLEARGDSPPPELSISQAPDFPELCLIDGDRIKQVLRNLLDNAWFACEDPRQIEVRLTFFPTSVETSYDSEPPDGRPTGATMKVTSGSGLIRLEVCDSGQGIPATDREKIFDPFFTTKTKGTGLGLALCRRYIEAHEGKIFAMENRQEGACLVIELPYSPHVARSHPEVIP
jgi:PAS domain S-box-containing protein